MAPNTTTQSHPGNNSAVSKHTVAAHFISRFADVQSFFDGQTNVFKPKRFLEETIGRFVGRSEPITIVFPGFAMKTPIHGGKVLGPLPDRAEELALARLEKFCGDIEEVYPPAARS
ncbi:hypothetical protein ON010_g2363 [Phytophthora cinnamomi]|nr:hypothetical protein ON010_g2363 [Phytophthora cinnamomi]